MGNPNAFKFSKPRLEGYNYSFSGLKTSFLYFLRDQLKENPNFIDENIHDLAASIQYSIVKSLTDKMEIAIQQTTFTNFALSGGVAANSALRNAMIQLSEKYNKKVCIPPLSLTTDNAAMIAVCGYFKYLKGEFSDLTKVPYSSIK